MPNTTTLNETLRTPADGTEFVRLATIGANWKMPLSAIYGIPFVATGRPSTDSIATRWSGTNIDVKSDYGAKGDGVTNDTTAIQNALNAAFGTGTGTIVSTAQRRVVFPPGKYIVRGGGLTATNWFGGIIEGSGRFTTIIQNADGGNVFTTNGCEYMLFQSMNLDGASGAGVLFDLDWNGAGGTTGSQSNTFHNMYFSNSGTGLRIANTGGIAMGSENLLLNCFFGNMSADGIYVVGPNALQQTIIGGDFQACVTNGIHINQGSVNVISGVGFQVNGQDIKIDGANANTMTVTGCRTESSNFINNAGSQSLSIIGCHQTTASSRGLFYTGVGGSIHMTGCDFDGIVDPRSSTRMCIQACRASNEVSSGDWLAFNPTFWWWIPNNVISLVIEIENFVSSFVTTGTVDQLIGKQRIFTTDGLTVTIQDYSVVDDATGTFIAKTKAGAPTISDVPAGSWQLIRDTTNNTTKIYYNNAGALMVIALV